MQQVHLETDSESPRSHEVLQDSSAAPLKQLLNVKPAQRRNRTYTRRKVEIHKLKNEVKILEKQKQFLASQEYLRHRRVQKQRELAHKAMRDAAQAQRLLFAASVSYLSQAMREMDVGPFSVPLKLGKDSHRRQTTLLRTRHERLQLAHQFMLQRLQFLDSSEFCDQKKFEASDGDLLSLHFETTPIPEAQNVKTIVDALQSFAYRINSNISNAVGGGTIRENSETKRESPVVHHRLVTSTEDLTQIESNTVAFTEYWPATLRDNAYGLLVCDTVDEDELFPYRPLERVRHDLNMIAMASWRMGKDGKPVVLLSRWWRQRIRKSRTQLPPSVEHFRRNVNKLDAAMLSIARNVARKT